MATKQFQNAKLNVTHLDLKDDASRSVLQSGENISHSLGKIARWYKDIIWTDSKATTEVFGIVKLSDDYRSVSTETVPTSKTLNDVVKLIKQTGGWNNTYEFNTNIDSDENLQNGQFKVTEHDLEGDIDHYVSIKGLGSAAYTESSDYATADHTHLYAGSDSVGGVANSAAKLSDIPVGGIGSETKPVFFSGTTGRPVACTYSLNATVPVNAIFTDEKVKQSPVTTDGSFEVLFAGSTGNTVKTESVGKTTTLTFNPSTGALSATSFSGNGSGLTSLNASKISSGTLAVRRLANSGVVAGTYGPAANASLAHAGTFDVPDFTVDAKGRVTGAHTRTFTLPAQYVHPTHTAYDKGLYKIIVDALGHITSATAVVKDDITALGIPAQDTVYKHPTYETKSSGLYKITVDGLGHVSATASVTKTDIPVLDYISSTTTRNANTVLAGPVSGTAAAPTFRALVADDLPSHTHTKSQITDFPTSLKNPNSLTVQGNGTTSFTYDGSAVKTLNIKPGTGISVSSDTSGNITITNTSTNTDTKVTQSVTNAGYYRPIVFGKTHTETVEDLAATITDQVYVSTKFYACPKTGTIYASTFSGALSGNADTATALTSSAGSATQPVYFSSGKPVVCTYTLGKSVPSNAVFTDTKVTQTNTTTAADYRVILSANANDTTETTTARKSTNFLANPSTGEFYAKGYRRIDITGNTVDINTYNLSSGAPMRMFFIEKTNDGAANITNIPVDNVPFLLDVELIKWVSATDYITRQIYTNAANPANSYVRYCTSGTWESWTKRVYTDTHYTSHLITGASATATANAAATNGNVYLNILDNTTVRDSHNIVGSGATTVTSDANGKITISSTNTVYTHPTYTARTGKPTANATPAFGGTFTVSQITSDGTGHVTGATDRTITIPNTTMGAATADTAGTIGLVPAPSAGKQTSFLRGDGTWVIPTNTDTKVKQTATTTNANYEVLFSVTADNTTRTEGARKNSNLTFNPSSGTLTTTKFEGSGESLTSLNASNISSGTLSADRLATSGATAGSYGPSANATPGYGATFNVPYITVDAKGRVTAISTKTVKIPASDNTNTTYTLSGAYGSSSNTWVTTLTPSSGSATTSTVPTGSTSAYGLMKLYNGVDSTSTALAATANAVKTAYDKANHSHPYVPKTTYEYNYEIKSPSGHVCIGKFPCYDTNITCNISITAANTINGTLVIATQNINTSGGGSYEAVVYGDPTNELVDLIYIDHPSGSNIFGVYLKKVSWGAILIHVQVVSNASGDPSDIRTIVSDIPTTATIRPSNVFEEIPTGGANLLQLFVGSGGNTSVTNNVLTIGTANKDTYFYLKAARPIKSGIRYVLSCDYESDSALYLLRKWVFGFGGQTNVGVQLFKNVYNNRAWCSFISTINVDANATITVDDKSRDVTNPITLSNFKLELGMTPSDYCLIDTSRVKTASSVTNSGWTAGAVDNNLVPSMSFIAYWNGAYSSNNVSNLRYCNQGAFGTIVTKGSEDYVPQYTISTATDINTVTATGFHHIKTQSCTNVPTTNHALLIVDSTVGTKFQIFIPDNDDTTWYKRHYDSTNSKWGSWATLKLTDTVYTHPTTSGNKHIPSGGSSGQVLKWSSDGTAVWASLPAIYDSASNLSMSSITIQTGSSTQSHITLETLMNWLINKHIVSSTYKYQTFATSWAYSNNDILQISINGSNKEVQLAGAIFEIWGSVSAYNAGVFRLRIHTAPSHSYTNASGYSHIGDAVVIEYSCNGSSYSPTWRYVSARSLITAQSTPGLYKIAYDNSGNIISTSAITKSDITGLGIPGSDTNTTYSFATGDNNGSFKVTPSGGTATNIAIKGLGSAAYTASSAYATASHAHGLGHSDFTTFINATTNTWAAIGVDGRKHVLKSIRTDVNAPPYLLGNYSAGIVFGGSDTRGLISVSYNTPQIKFAGGAGTATEGGTAKWYITLTGTHNTTYNLDTMHQVTQTATTTSA